LVKVNTSNVGVKIRKTPGFFVIEDESGTVAKLKDKVVLNKEHYFTSKMLSEEKKELTSPQDISTSTSINEPTAGPLGFRPPDFGVTILGSSHGFDCKGSTSGYILWINQRGVMVDPPPFSSYCSSPNPDRTCVSSASRPTSSIK